MNKELYVSSTPHETKVALVEDDQLAEVYFERENEYTLAGSIYKGRVTRVLPGMQSAFVDIGLERDAFLYVSDFLDFAGEEDEEEFGEVQVRPQLAEIRQSPAEAASAGPEAEEPEEEEFAEEAEDPAEVSEAGTTTADTQDAEGAHRWRGRRRRRGRRAGRERGPEPQPANLPAETAPGEPQPSVASEELEPETPLAAQEERAVPEAIPANKESAGYEGMPVDYAPVVLPGESIARYSRGADAPRDESERVPEPRQEFPSRRDDFRGRRGGRDRERGGRDRERGGRDREREPREEYSLPENYTPIVLPGESISKYRKQESGPMTPPEVTPSAGSERSDAGFAVEAGGIAEPAASASPEPSAEALPSTTAEATATDAAASTPAVYEAELGSPEPQAEEPLTEARVSEPKPPAYRQFTAPVDHVAEDTPASPVAEKESSPSVIVPPNEPEPEALHKAPDESVEDLSPSVAPPTVEEPTVAAEAVAAKPGESDGPLPSATEEVVSLASAEGYVVSSPILSPAGNGGEVPSPLTHRAVPPAEPQVSVGDAYTAPRSGSYSPEGGPVVHEELEGEETDMPSYAEHFNTENHQEIVEQVFDRLKEAANGDLLGQTVREAGEERALDESEYDFDAEDGEEFEESEIVAEPEFAGEEEEDEESARPAELSEGGRAELRAPGMAPGYQQRSERAYPERGGREQRGRHGRPMRTRREASRPVPLISDLLKEGQEVLIQIAKEPIGKKGARITSHIALPGRFLVYMPTVNHIGVSRKISSDDERQRLKRIVASERENGHGGFIVRTAASGIKEDELRADIRFLKHLWNEIRSRADNSKSPALIYHDLNLVERILRDQVTQDFSQIWVDSEQEYERVVRFASRFQPNLVKRIKLYTKPTPLFEQFGIQEEINKSLKSKVWLKSGGYIVINQTEALVAIDINTGKYVGKTARLEDTIVKTNCDAIKEIVRQVRLRDLGGIIVIDFIDMDERKNRQKVMQALEEALKSDRAPSKVLQFNDFGLVAITRKRVKQSLERTLGSPCPYCAATGFVKSVTTVCNEIYSEMRKIRPHVEAADIVMRLNPEVAKELKSNNGKWLAEMEELVRRPILVKSDPLLHQEQFDIQF
jgi:ribonuclease G